MLCVGSSFKMITETKDIVMRISINTASFREGKSCRDTSDESKVEIDDNFRGKPSCIIWNRCQYFKFI